MNKMKGGIDIEIIVHFPKTAEKQEKLAALFARIHGEYVSECIEGLNCSTEQKLKLLDAVAKTILENAKEKGN